MSPLRTLAVALLVACSGGTTDSDPPVATDSPSDTDTGTTTTATGHTGTTWTGTGVPPVTGDPLTVPLAGACPLADKYGAFLVERDEFYSLVDGSIAEGVVPITVLEQIVVEGDCVLLRRNNPFCNPPCSGTETCDFDGQCIPFPENQDIGTVTVGGLLQDVIMTPIQPGNSYFDTSLPHPAWNEGDLIELRTGGGAFDRIELHGIGVQELTLPTSDPLVVVDGEPLDVVWNPPVGTVRSHVHLQLNIDQHGNTPTQVFCEFDDDGAGQVPASAITELVRFGVTGFPNATLTRRTVDSTTLSGGGCAEFRVASPKNPDVRVEGFIPCPLTGPDTCPPPLTCNRVLGQCQ